MPQPPLIVTKPQNWVNLQPKPTTPTNRGTTQPKLKSLIRANHAPASSSRITQTNMKGSTQQMIKEPIMHDTPTMRVIPPCALFGQQVHATKMLPTLPEINNLINTPISATFSPLMNTRGTSNPSTPKSNKLRTNKSCSICSHFGNYTHTIAPITIDFGTHSKPVTSQK